MKLTPEHVERTIVQFQAVALPDTHSAHPKLEEMFGEHTFLLNDNGLHIVEAMEPSDTGDKLGHVVKIASWQDPEHTSLAPHKPEPTDVVIVFEAAA